MSATREINEGIEVWREPSGFWRWRYLDAEHPTELLSSRGYESRDEAMAAARLAYPGVPMASTPRRHTTRRLPMMIVLSVPLAGLGVVAAVVLVLVRVVLRVRRLGRRARRTARLVGTVAAMASSTGRPVMP
jgi:hypothetical protein